MSIKTIWKRMGVAVAVAVALPIMITAPIPAAASPVDVYTTPGIHNVNGRQWRTSCEPYSQTSRCRTEIKATQVTRVKGRFVKTTGWVFNNLTYAASPRSLWTKNLLGGNGKVGGKVSWTSTDGRQWRTECDTSLTGRNGCRSYLVATVIEAYKTSKGSEAYREVTKEVFNNLVRFGAIKPTPSAPSTPASPPQGGSQPGTPFDGQAPSIAAGKHLITSEVGIQEVLMLINQARAKKGIPALTYSPNLEKLAKTESSDFENWKTLKYSWSQSGTWIFEDAPDSGTWMIYNKDYEKTLIYSRDFTHIGLAPDKFSPWADGTECWTLTILLGTK